MNHQLQSSYPVYRRQLVSSSKSLTFSIYIGFAKQIQPSDCEQWEHTGFRKGN